MTFLDSAGPRSALQPAGMIPLSNSATISSNVSKVRRSMRSPGHPSAKNAGIRSQNIWCSDDGVTSSVLIRPVRIWRARSSVAFVMTCFAANVMQHSKMANSIMKNSGARMANSSAAAPLRSRANRRTAASFERRHPLTCTGRAGFMTSPGSPSAGHHAVGLLLGRGPERSFAEWRAVQRLDVARAVNAYGLVHLPGDGQLGIHDDLAIVIEHNQVGLS